MGGSAITGQSTEKVKREDRLQAEQRSINSGETEGGMGAHETLRMVRKAARRAGQGNAGKSRVESFRGESDRVKVLHDAVMQSRTGT